MSQYHDNGSIRPRPAPSWHTAWARGRRCAAVVALKLAALLALLLATTLPAAAVLKIDIRKGNIAPLVIAVPEFTAEQPSAAEVGKDLSLVVEQDLGSSGLFAPIPRKSHLSKGGGVDRRPNFNNWRLLDAQVLVNGSVEIEDDILKVRVRVWDVVAQEQLVANQYSTKRNNWRRIGHIVSDAIYQRLTGEPGYFDSRVVFIDESGPKNKRIKRLAVMDQDGSNRQVLTDGKQLVLTPRYSPVADEITFMSYVNNEPRVYTFNLQTGEQNLVGRFPGMTYAPRFSSDGKQIVMSLADGANSNIFIYDQKSKRARRITNDNSINTAPSFSPDGKNIAFESDRGGSQQIYVMRTDGTGQKRISFGQGRYATPVFSPDGEWIAFTKLLKSNFYIGIMRPDGSGERLLTKGYHNEGPTWAPNSKQIMFFRESRGISGGPKIYAIDLTGRRERQISTPNFASDPAWSPGIDVN